LPSLIGGGNHRSRAQIVGILVFVLGLIVLLNCLIFLFLAHRSLTFPSLSLHTSHPPPITSTTPTHTLPTAEKEIRHNPDDGKSTKPQEKQVEPGHSQQHIAATTILSPDSLPTLTDTPPNEPPPTPVPSTIAPSTPTPTPTSVVPRADVSEADDVEQRAIMNWALSNSNPTCDAVFGSGMLRRWDETKAVFCEPTQEQERPPGTADLVAPSSNSAPSVEVDTTALRNQLQSISQSGVGALTTDGNDRLDPPPGRIVCRSTTLPFMPPPTAPHSFCSGRNVFIDLSEFKPGADAPRHRAHYAMGRGHHYHYRAGETFTAACARTSAFNIRRISADHQRDVVEAIGSIQEKHRLVWKDYIQRLAEGKETLYAPSQLQSRDNQLTSGQDVAGSRQLLPSALSSDPSRLIVLPHSLLLITRENGEHCNFYHTLTDLYNAWLMMRNFGVTRESTQILFLDNHGPSPFDDAWQQVFSAAGPVLRVNELMERGLSQSMLFAGSIMISPPGYSSPLYRHLMDVHDPECSSKADLVAQFAADFLHAHHVPYHAWKTTDTLASVAHVTDEDVQKAVRATWISGMRRQAGEVNRTLADASATNADDDVLHVLFVSRRPYDHFVSHKKINRQIFNEDTLLDFMTPTPASDPSSSNTHPYTDVRVDLVDMARIPFSAQLRLVASSDVLVGMHGAALSHSVFLPPWSSLLELHPRGQRWQCFKHLSEWSGHEYFAWRNERPAMEQQREDGSGVTVDPNAFKPVFDRALDAARQKRKELRQRKEQARLNGK